MSPAMRIVAAAASAAARRRRPASSRRSESALDRIDAVADARRKLGKPAGDVVHGVAFPEEVR